MVEAEKKSLREHLWGWPVVGSGATVLFGFGGNVMTGPHPYIADAFFFLGFSLLIIKLWAWEEAKHDTTRKTAMLLTGATVGALLLFAGTCWLSFYLNTPKQVANETPHAALSPPGQTPLSSPGTQISAPSPVHARKPTASKEKANTAPTMAAPSKQQPGVFIGGNVDQSGDGCQQKIIGGNNNNNFCSPPQRRLTAKQGAVVASLGKHVKETAVYCYVADLEGCKYAHDFWQYMHDAGINVGTQVGILFGTPIDSEVYLAVHSPQDSPAYFEEVFHEWQAAGIPVKGRLSSDDVAAGEMQIHIGRR